MGATSVTAATVPRATVAAGESAERAGEPGTVDAAMTYVYITAVAAMDAVRDASDASAREEDDWSGRSGCGGRVVRGTRHTHRGDSIAGGRARRRAQQMRLTSGDGMRGSAALDETWPLALPPLELSSLPSAAAATAANAAAFVGDAVSFSARR